VNTTEWNSFAGNELDDMLRNLEQNCGQHTILTIELPEIVLEGARSDWQWRLGQCPALMTLNLHRTRTQDLNFGGALSFRNARR
jgi:hypothetical protein